MSCQNMPNREIRLLNKILWLNCPRKPRVWWWEQLEKNLAETISYIIRISPRNRVRWRRLQTDKYGQLLSVIKYRGASENMDMVCPASCADTFNCWKNVRKLETMNDGSNTQVPNDKAFSIMVVMNQSSTISWQTDNDPQHPIEILCEISPAFPSLVRPEQWYSMRKFFTDFITGSDNR